MNYLAITKNDIANGTGIRVTLWISGCTMRCEGCHNQESWDFNAGKLFTDETIKELFDEVDKPWVNGLTLSGGHPLEPENRNAVADLLQQFRKRFGNTKSVWLYTGYTWEYIIEQPVLSDICNVCDVIVDGKFVLSKRDITLKFRGSGNQRIIDCRESIKNNQIITIN